MNGYDLWKKDQEEKNKKESSTSAYEYWKKDRDQKLIAQGISPDLYDALTSTYKRSSALDAQFKKWAADYDSLVNEYRSRFSGRSGTYKDPFLADIGAWTDDYNARSYKLIKDTYQLRSLLDQNQDLLGEDLNPMLDEAVKNLTKIREGYSSYNSFYGQFKDDEEGTAEDKYKQWQEHYWATSDETRKERDQWYDDSLRKLKTMPDGEEKEELQAKVNRYIRGEGEFSISDRKDKYATGFATPIQDDIATRLKDRAFRENANKAAAVTHIPDADEAEYRMNLELSGYSERDPMFGDNYFVSDYDGTALVSDGKGGFIHPELKTGKYSNDDRLGIYLSLGEGDIKNSADKDIRSVTWNEGINKHWDYMTTDEIVYYYGLRAENPEKADQFLDDIQRDLNHRYQLLTNIETAEEYRKAPWFGKLWMNAKSVFGNVGYAIPAMVSTMTATMAGEVPDIYGAGFRGMHYSDTVRGETASAIDAEFPNFELFGMTGGELYQAGMSGIDSIATRFIPGGRFALAASAGAHDAMDKYKAGATSGQIGVGAATAFGTELLTESLQIDQMRLLRAKDVATWTDYLLNLVKAAGVEYGEESLSYLINGAVDVMNRKSQAEWAEMLEKNDGNYFGLALDILGEANKEGMSGAFSGGGSAAITTVSNSARGVNATKSIGSTIKGQQGGVDLLKAAATEQSPLIDKGLAKYAAKTTADSSDKRVGKLALRSRQATTAAETAAKLQVLESQGYSAKDARDLLRTADTYSMGGQISKAQKAALDKAMSNPDVADILVNKPISFVDNLGHRITFEQDSTQRIRNLERIKKTIDAENRIKLAEDGKAVNPDGFVEENGELKVKTDDGTVSHEDMRYDSKEQGIAYETIYGLGITDAAEANRLLNGHTEADGLTDSEWSEGITDAFLFGRAGVDFDAMATTTTTAKLLDTQRMAAYRIGQAHMGETDTQDNIDLRNALKEESKRLKRKPGEKGVYVRNQDGSYTKVSDYMAANKDLNKRQTTAIRVMEEFSEVMGARVNLFQAFEEDGKKYYINHLGKKTEGNPNGFYDKSTGEIYVAMDAGATQANAFTDTMLFTFAHEVTHFIKDWSPTHFEKIASTLIRQAGFDGKMADLIAGQQDKAMRIRKEKISEETALEELVADSMETILRSGRVVETMAKIKKVDAEAHAKLKGWFKKLRRFLRRMVDVYGNQNANTAEGKIVEGFAEDLLQQLEQLFAEGAVEAGKNYQAAREQGIDALAEDGIVFDEATDSVFALRDSFATNDVLSVGRKNFDVKAVAEMISNVTGRSIEDSEKWVRSELTIANMVLANPEFLDFAADSRYEAIKKNSDYPQGTVDLSNLCPKREEFTAMFDLLQKTYPNKLFTAQDIAEMRKILSDAGITVACGACFVEDRRQLIGEIADTFIEMWKEAVNTGAPLKKTNADGKKIELLVTKELATKYGLTPGTKIMATDTYIPNQYDLTTYEGFRLLEKNHPQIAMGFNRYNNSRGQQSARLIEGRAEYKRQILGWSPAKVKSVNNNGGLRIFSFSDFEVVHLLDLVQVIIDCAAKGVKIQGYTKIPAFAKLVRNTGIKLNRSLIPMGDLGYHMEGGKVVLDYDSTEGIDINDDNFLDERDNPNVGNIVIGINPTQIGAAMLDPFIDYIIPFHSNKAKAILKKLGTGEWINYKESQHERDISTGKASKKNVNIYTQVINKYNPGNKVDFVNAFLKECQKQGKIPRYAEFLNKEYTESGAYRDEYGAFNYTYREGYHKLLVDFKMFDSNGNILPQGEITPDLDNEFMQELLNAEVDRKRSYQFPHEVYDAIDKKFGDHDLAMSDRDEGQTMLQDRDFTYTELTAKKPLAGRIIDKNRTVRLTSDGSIDKSWVVSEVLSQCESISTKAPTPTYYVTVADIGKNVEITSKPIEHGFIKYQPKNGKPVPPRSMINARAVLDLPQILANSIEVNRSDRGDNGEVEFSHVLIGITAMETANGSVEYYAVRSVVEARKNQGAILTEANVIGKLHAMNAKKIGMPHAQVSGNNTALTSSSLFAYSVADLLNDVKHEFNDTFSNDVYKHLGIARASTPFSAYLKFQERDTGAAETKLRRQRDAAKDKARSVSKDLRTMEKEFLRLVKQYDREETRAAKAEARADKAEARTDKAKARADKAAAKSATRIDDLKAALRKEAASHRENRKTWEAEFTRLLREYERSDRNVDRLEERLQRQRDAIEAKAESIKKIVVKHSIRKKIMNLNKLFTRGTKEKNVKAGMRDFAASALASADILFTDTVTNQDLIRNGIGTELTEAESRLLNETADLMAKINDLSGYDNLDERDKLEAKMKRNMTALRDVFARERARLEKATIAGVLNDLAEEYHKLEIAKEPHLQNTYSESVYQYLKDLQETVGGTKIKDMSLSQLESLNKAYGMVLGTIQAANKIFRNGRYEDAAARTDRVQSELKKISASEKDPTARGAKVGDFLRSFTWNELRPVDAFERLGSEAMKELFWDLVYAQGEFGSMAEEIAAAFENARKKYGYSKWDLNTAKEYDTVDGKKFRVTLLDRMSIYAYSKRPHADKHMTDGGFVFDSTSTYKDEKSGVKRKHKKLSSPYRLSNADITEIANSIIEDEAVKAYVDEIQKFMKEFGERGNKVSRALYGVDLFTEEAYFPLQSEKDYINTTDQALNSTATMVSLKNTGMTKPTVPHASNPIVLRAFDDIVLDHLDTMSKYIAYVLPIENIQKVYNNVGRVVTGDNGYVSTQALIGSKFGAAAQQYFEQFIKDLNGASFTSGAKSPFDGLFSKGKAAAIAANASVMIQQYSAVIRAMNEISPQYMIPFLNASASRAADGKIYDELKKYAPVAVIKEMGGYDTGSSRTLKEYVQHRNAPMSFEKTMSKAKDVFSWGAQQMDKIGWSTIWRAVKKEIADTTDLKIGSEEFLQACGKRFTEVVTKTQVYDSVISRSGFMRSKHDSVKYLTTYMGEPTVIVGMLFSSHLELVRAIKSKDGRRIWKAARKTLRTGMAVAGSSIVNELLKALVYAARYDDEDEAYLERVAKHFGDGLSGQLNPFNLFSLLPGTRDIVSLIEGFDVDRPDVTLIGYLIKSSTKFIAALGDEDADHVEASLNFLGDLGNIFGIPAKNIIRDIKATFNFYDDMTDEIYPTNVGGAFAEGFTGEEPTKHENLYDVIVRGEKSRIDALKKGYVDEDGNFDQDKYDTAVRKALRDGDPRIRKAAIAYHDGNYTEYDSIMDEIEAEGHFDREIIAGAVKAQHNDMFPSEKESKDTVKAEYDGDDLRRAIVSGDADEIGLVKDNMIQTDIANGKTEEEANESFMSKARSEIKKAFKEDSIDEDKAVDLLVEYGQEEEAAVDTVNHLAFQLDYPEYKELSMTDVRDWYEYAEGVVPLDIYYDFTMKAKDIEGDDRNGDGKADSGSKKRKIQELARSYGLTGAQIRALMNTQ